MTDDKICELAQRPYRGKDSGNRLIAYINGCFDTREAIAEEVKQWIEIQSQARRITFGDTMLEHLTNFIMGKQ